MHTATHPFPAAKHTLKGGGLDSRLRTEIPKTIL